MISLKRICFGFIFTILILPSTYLKAAQEVSPYKRGVNYYLDGNIPEALKSLETAYEESPDNKEIKSLYTEVMVLRAGEFFKSKEYQRAYDIIKKAKELKPKDDKINQIYEMLDNKLFPEKTELKTSEKSEDIFTDITEKEEEKREQRVKIIREPPEKLTVKERELLRPIIIGSNNPQKDNKILYYFIGGSILLFILFAGIAVYFIKQLITSNRESLKELSEVSSEKVHNMEKELKRLKSERQRQEKEYKKDNLRKERKARIDREKIKNEYAKLLEESMQSKKRAPVSKIEPKISESPSPDKEKETEIKSSFRKLKRINYANAIKLLKQFTKKKDPWIKLWAAELASEIAPSDAVSVLKDLVSSDEYQVKKRALKTLKNFLDSNKTSAEDKQMIKTLIASTRKDGWVV